MQKVEIVSFLKVEWRENVVRVESSSTFVMHVVLLLFSRWEELKFNLENFLANREMLDQYLAPFLGGVVKKRQSFCGLSDRKGGEGSAPSALNVGEPVKNYLADS